VLTFWKGAFDLIDEFPRQVLVKQ
jgi:hypothetical protein